MATTAVSSATLRSVMTSARSATKRLKEIGDIKDLCGDPFNATSKGREYYPSEPEISCPAAMN